MEKLIQYAKQRDIRLENGEMIHHNNPIELFSQDGEAFCFDGRMGGRVFRYYRKIPSKEQLDTMAEHVRKCYENGAIVVPDLLHNKKREVYENCYERDLIPYFIGEQAEQSISIFPDHHR